MAKEVKLYALYEKGKLCHYYSLAFICFTKKQAKIERDMYNKELGHKMEIRRVKLTKTT